LQINDLLQIQGEKRWKFNELLTRKIKALKDEEIDCSNTSAFVAQVENRFMLTKTGVDFCFDSQKQGRQFAIISLTWAELEGFLKTDGQRR
jgi:folate-binding Fe-S cluster repair protein YgfZ